MKSNNTFGVHFVLRTSRPSDDDKFPVYARIVVNATRCEFSMKQSLSKADWNFGKGEAKPRNAELRAFNCYMQEMQGKIHRHYRDLLLEDEPLTATAVKAAFLGIGKEPAISAKVTQTKIGMDMNLLQDRLNNNRAVPTLKAVK